MPAKVAGTWTLPDGELTLHAGVPDGVGHAAAGATERRPLTEGRLRGEEITFTVGGVTYTGKVNGTTMQGTTSTGAKWTATRAAQ